MPPILPGKIIEPLTLGGVKIPSARLLRIMSWHHLRSSSVRPQAFSAVSDCGTSGLGRIGNGCVEEVFSRGTSLAGAGRSSTPKIGSPVSRFSRNRFPVFDPTAIAGISLPSRRMEAEKKMGIPISLRSGFAISTENRKAANAMTEDEWEEFYDALSKHLRRNYPDLYARAACGFNRRFPFSHLTTPIRRRGRRIMTLYTSQKRPAPRDLMLLGFK